MIITIARECGCYGDLIGEKLGEKLGIPVYDKKSVTQMAKEAGIYSKYPNFFSEKQANEFLAAIISDECETVKDTPQKALSAVIKDESFLLIGRCGNFAYGTDHNVLRIFLSGNRQIRVGNIMRKHNVNVREAENTVDSTDERRAAYHKYYTDETWGYAGNYDLCLDACRLGVDGVIDIVLQYIKRPEWRKISMSYKLAIFDLDGTLLNTIRDLADSVNYALEKNGFPKRTLEEVTKFVGNGIRKLVVRAVPKGTDEHMTDVVFEDFKEYYGKHCADKTEKYPGIDYVLDSLHKERCRTAVISNKADYAVKILCDDFFPGKFDAVYGERESMGIKKKPDPQAVLAVLDEFKTDRKDAVYIGDSEVDIATAKNAGVDGIIVSWGFREKEILIQNGAECIVDTSQELVDKILG